MYGYHRKSTTAPFLGETHTFVQQVTNHYLTPISSHHKQRQLHQQGPGSKPMLLLRQPFEGKANPGNPWMFMIDKHHPYWYQWKPSTFFLVAMISRSVLFIPYFHPIYPILWGGFCWTCCETKDQWILCQKSKFSGETKEFPWRLLSWTLFKTKP